MRVKVVRPIASLPASAQERPATRDRTADDVLRAGVPCLAPSPAEYPACTPAAAEEPSPAYPGHLQLARLRSAPGPLAHAEGPGLSPTRTSRRARALRE